MYLETENTILTNTIYYTNNIIVSSEPITVYKIDTVADERIELSRNTAPVSGNISLFENQYTVNEESGILYFPLNLVGQSIEIRYFTEGNINPFKTTGNIGNFIERFISWGNNRIIDGLFLYQNVYDKSHNRHIKRGSFVINGNYYIVNDITLNFRNHGVPSVRGRYNCVYFFINPTIVEDYLSENNKELVNVGILTSSTHHETQNEARTDVIARYTTTYGNINTLRIAFVYVLVDDDNNILYWTEYPKDSRLVVL